MITAPDPTPEQLLGQARMYRRQAVWNFILSAAFLALAAVELVRHATAYFSLAMGTLWLLTAAVSAWRSRRYQ